MSLLSPPQQTHPDRIAARAGIGLRGPHARELADRSPPIGWLEVHSENYFDCGGMPARLLSDLRSRYPLSMHGVGMSLGSTDPLDLAHLKQLKDAVARFEPDLVSDHLCWSSVGGRFFNDLLPLPYTHEALNHVARRVMAVQEFLGRQILVENLSSYLEFNDADLSEPQFLAELAQRAGCALLLDVNNVYVSARNHGFDAQAYLRAIPAQVVKEIHLAGHSVNAIDGREILIDTHDQRVSPDVWRLYESALQRFGARPTLIEWDSDLPALDVLINEMQIADERIYAFQEPIYARAA